MKSIGLRPTTISATTLAILPNCNTAERCERWLGPLSSGIGCGMHGLAFMEEIDRKNFDTGLAKAKAEGGTPFQYVTNWFNMRATKEKLPYMFQERIFPIHTEAFLKEFFDTLQVNLPDNSCLLVRWNRDKALAKSIRMVSGHYSVLSKENGEFYTYEPLLSQKGKCDKRIYKNLRDPTISKGMGITFHSTNKYITASVLVMEPIVRMDIDASGDTKMIGGAIIPTVASPIPAAMFEEFESTFDNCKIAGIRKRKTRKQSRKKRTTKRR